MASVREGSAETVGQQSALVLRLLAGAAIACLTVGLVAHLAVPNADWPRRVVLVGTGVVVAAPVVALIGIAARSSSPRTRAFAIAGVVITVIGALLAR